MSSKIARRSGNAVTDYCSLIGWKPNQIHIVGVGTGHGEVESFQERWIDVPIIGYEPHPWTYDGLKDRFPGKLFHCGISNKAGKATLYCAKAWKNGASIFPPTSHEAIHQFEVDLFTLDHLMQGFENPVRDALLWLDCEGCELAALEGAEKFLQNVSAVNAEFTGKARGLGWATPVQIHEFLITNGFYQALVHTIRPVIGQYDSLYLREEIFKPDFSTCPDSVMRLQNVQRSRSNGHQGSDLRRSSLRENDQGDGRGGSA